MTQKELLYVEDAVGHEKSIIKILEESSKNTDDDHLLEFFENEKEKHKNLKNNLLTYMEELANGQ